VEWRGESRVDMRGEMGRREEKVEWRGESRVDMRGEMGRKEE